MLHKDLTPVDVRILEQVQKDSSLSTSDLAEKVGLSQSPCWRRLQRLREDGVIRGEVALLDRRKLGTTLLIFAKLRVDTLTEQERAKFILRVQDTKEILECHTLFGEDDILIKVIAPSLEWYQNFVFKTVLKLPGVRDIRSTVTLSEVKYTTELPVRGFVDL